VGTEEHLGCDVYFCKSLRNYTTSHPPSVWSKYWPLRAPQISSGHEYVGSK